jgi:hypothetical protein
VASVISLASPRLQLQDSAAAERRERGARAPGGVGSQGGDREFTNCISIFFFALFHSFTRKRLSDRWSPGGAGPPAIHSLPPARAT